MAASARTRAKRQGLACKVIIDSPEAPERTGEHRYLGHPGEQGLPGLAAPPGLRAFGKETMRFTTPDGFDFGGDPVNDWGSAAFSTRKISAALRGDAPAENSEFFLEDPISKIRELCPGRRKSPVLGRKFSSEQETSLPSNFEKYRMDDGTELKYIVVPGQR